MQVGTLKSAWKWSPRLTAAQRQVGTRFPTSLTDALSVRKRREDDVHRHSRGEKHFLVMSTAKWMGEWKAPRRLKTNGKKYVKFHRRISPGAIRSGQVTKCTFTSKRRWLTAIASFRRSRGWAKCRIYSPRKMGGNSIGIIIIRSSVCYPALGMRELCRNCRYSR